MSKVYTRLSRFSLGCGVFTSGRTVDLRPCATRMLSVTSPLHVKSRTPVDVDDDDTEANKPIKFSTSRASHRTWNVDRSMGSNFQRPWWKVLPISLTGVAFLLWCVFRKETKIDETLDKTLNDQLSGLQSDEEKEADVKNKPS